jgi:DNA-binding NtrC family response regulator
MIKITYKEDISMSQEQILPMGAVTVQSMIQEEENGTVDFLTLEEVERRHIEKALSTFKNNKTVAAKALGISLKTLYNKLHMYGMMGKANDAR